MVVHVLPLVEYCQVPVPAVAMTAMPGWVWMLPSESL